MKIIIFAEDKTQNFETEVTRVYNSGQINYGFKHKQFRGFQFDDYNRPYHNSKEVAKTIYYNGYLIAKKGFSHLECKITVEY